MNDKGRISILVILLIVLGAGLFFLYEVFVKYNSVAVVSRSQQQEVQAVATNTIPAVSEEVLPADSTTSFAPEVVQRITIPTPKEVRAIYISGWTAGTPSRLQHIMDIIDQGVINAVVIDSKDSTGRLSYQPLDETLKKTGVGTNRIANLEKVITAFHDKNIYVIARIAVFQDSYLSEQHPEYAYTDSKTGKAWNDVRKLGWVRTDIPAVWEYNAAIAKDAIAQGFDEINIDYVRFPSDGVLTTIKERPSTSAQRIAMLEDFFKYMDIAIRQELQVPLSADIFGLALSAKDDLGIGQKLENIAPYVDYIAPMIYPSHFADGTYGFKKPALKPYEVITKSLSDGLAKFTAAGIDPIKMRPWLQDFNLGAIYTKDMVLAQVRASEDQGVLSWMMWDASNQYTKDAFQ